MRRRIKCVFLALLLCAVVCAAACAESAEEAPASEATQRQETEAASDAEAEELPTPETESDAEPLPEPSGGQDGEPSDEQSEDAPEEQGAQDSDEGQEPLEEEQEPSGEEEEPSGEEEEPSGEEEEPSGEDEEPSGEEEDPSGEDEESSDEEDEPSDEEEPSEEEEPADEPEDALTISVTGSEPAENDWWLLRYRSEEDSVELRWNSVEGAFLYCVQVVVGEETVYDEETEGALLMLFVSDVLPENAGEKTDLALIVDALAEDRSPVASGRLLLQLIRQGGKRPGGHGGWQRGTGGASQGFRVTPGTALISAHTNGDRSMRLYGSVEIPVSDEPVDRLTLGDEVIASDGAFTVAVDAGVLALEPASDCEAWTFSAKALKTLGKSGIDTLVLYVNEQQIEIPTALKMQGLVYASLSARGIVSKDYVFTVSGSGIEVAVDGERYRLSADYELTGG